MNNYITAGVVAYLAFFIYFIDFNTFPELRMSDVELVRSYGYDIEEHLVESEDGFISLVHKLKGRNNVSKKNNTNVVIFLPGLHLSSPTFFAGGPKYSELVFRTVDKGLDLWIANFRGSVYTQPKNNNYLTDRQLYDFSFHEQGFYDLPAIIDFVLKHTGKKKVNLVATSLATEIAYAMLSMRPEYNDKVSKIILLCPVGPFSDFTTFSQKLLETVLTSSKIISDYLTSLQRYRAEFIYLTCVHPLSPIDCFPLADAYIGIFLNVTSEEKKYITALQVKTLFTGPFWGSHEHFLQLIHTRRWTMRDYGKDENLKIYGTEEPPDYNMANVKVPAKIYYSEADKFLSDWGEKYMFEIMPNVESSMKIKFPFQHGNFLFNSKVDPFYLEDVIKTMDQDQL